MNLVFSCFSQCQCLGSNRSPHLKLHNNICSVPYIMLSPHRLIFCHKELREKVRYFIIVSQRTWTNFISQTNHRIYLTIFHESVIWRTQPNFLSEPFCVTMAGEVPLLDYVKPIFHRTDVRVQEQIFCYKQLRENSDQFLIGPKVSRHKPIFTLIYCLGQKKGLCALDINIIIM